MCFVIGNVYGLFLCLLMFYGSSSVVSVVISDHTHLLSR